MYAIVSVTVRNGLQSLPDNLFGKYLWTSVWVPLNFVEYGVLTVFEHQVQFSFTPKHLEQVHKIWMFQCLNKKIFFNNHLNINII